jgi:uncharacterized DUF497 family protein
MGYREGAKQSRQARGELRGGLSPVLDPHRVEIIDDRFDYDEERLQIIGLSSQRILLVVTISHAQDHRRIISARAASRREESHYLRGEP